MKVDLSREVGVLRRSVDHPGRRRGQARLRGSCLTTSSVLKIPWTEHSVTSNWSLQKHRCLFLFVSMML
jgi:hypothetical protein